ncbi:uncharacterized protein LOC126735324 isoform X2 [Anthonomus grandis grandis]|nr:uncharacterized protein LOC126735324 isoform X2 [Anthonomus grandis grandis]
MKEFVPEEDAEVCIRALKFDNLSTEDFDSYWKACRQFRMADIKKMESTTAIFDKWLFYKIPSGFRLNDMDFDALHPNGDALLSTWETKRDAIVNFLSNDNVKDKNIKCSLEYIKNNEVSENSLNATILWPLHGYLVPTSRTVCKDKAGKNSVIKYTIKDSQEAFVLQRKSHQDLDDHLLHHLANRKTTIQPLLLLV